MRQLQLFFHLFFRFNIRHLIIHWKRTVAVLVGISLGAAVFSSVRLSVRASVDAFDTSMERLMGKAQWVLRAQGKRLDDHLVAQLLKDPAVMTASPVLTAHVRLAHSQADPFFIIGVDPILDGPIRQWQVSDNAATRSHWLDLLIHPYTLIAGKPLLSQWQKKPGDTVVLSHLGRDVPFRIVAALSKDGLALAQSGRIAIMDIATFQEFTGLHGQADRVDLMLTSGSTPNDMQRIRNLLPDGVIMAPGSEARETGKKMIRSYQINLSLLSFVSLFVGMFLIYSLIAINAASRRHELSVLGAIGASGKLLFALFICEGVFLGIFGWLIAIPISTLMVKFMIQGISGTISTLFVKVQVDQLSLNGWEIGLSFAITVAVSILGAFVPARNVMTIPAREALMKGRLDLHRRFHDRLGWIGLLLILLALPLCMFPGFKGIPIPGYLAVLGLFVGFSLMAPWWVRKTGTLMMPVCRRIGGEPAHLAARYIHSSGIRSAISVGALITAVALFVALAIMIHSFRQTVRVWVQQTISGDAFLRPDISELNQHRFPLPEKTIQALKQLEAPVDLVPDWRVSLTGYGVAYEFHTLDFHTFFKYGSFLFIKGNQSQVQPDLIQGNGVLISEVFSNRSGLSLGDRFQCVVADRLLDVPVLGVIRDYRTSGGVVYYSLQALENRLPLSNGSLPWTGVRLFFKDRHGINPSALAKLRQEIYQCCGQVVEMIEGNQLRKTILTIFDETFAVTFVLLIIALTIAAIGIATTLSVSVLQRRVEINTLYAVGASRQQIRRMILWESLFLVISGETAGICCGYILSVILVYVINRQSFGWTFVYCVDWQSLAVSLPLIILAALGAALPAIGLVLKQPPATILREN